MTVGLPGMSATPADLARVLLERRRTAFTQNQALGAELRGRASLAVKALRQEGLIDAAWLVGSLAWGGFGAQSDVDIVVRGARSETRGALWLRLGDRLDHAIDLLRLEELSPTFARRVLDEGERLDEP
jgi:predicted nucleotidyltransferase